MEFSMAECRATVKLIVFKKVSLTINGDLRYSENDKSSSCNTVFSLAGHFKDENDNEEDDNQLAEEETKTMPKSIMRVVTGNVQTVVHHNRQTITREILEKSNVNIRTAVSVFREDFDHSEVIRKNLSLLLFTCAKDKFWLNQKKLFQCRNTSNVCFCKSKKDDVLEIMYQLLVHSLVLTFCKLDCFMLYNNVIV